MIVPTTNQVTEILRRLKDGFGDIEVMEIMLRKYKTLAERVRPEDRMVAHTGYLIFARSLVEAEDEMINPEPSETNRVEPENELGSLDEEE